MSDGLNPFQSPSTQSFGMPRIAPPWLLDRVRIPSICLIVLSVLSLLHRISDLVMSIYILSDPLAFPGGPLGRTHLEIAAVADVLSVVVSLVMILGSWQMLQGKYHTFSMATAVLAVIPCLSPCILLGIPFGIWALIILADEQTRASFL